MTRKGTPAKIILDSADALLQSEDEILNKANETLCSVKEALKKSNMVLESANETLRRNNTMTSLNIQKRNSNTNYYHVLTGQ